MEDSEKKKSKSNSSIIWVVLVIVIIVGAWLWWSGMLGGEAAGVGYQAVFLTNDQVYFGKLTNVNSAYPTLREVYYLQVTQALQPKDQNAPASSNINLVKLGGELHGPEDEMKINREHILFFENLKADSQVVNAIKSYKEGKNK